MRYKVHRLDLKMDNDRRQLKEFLNVLNGDIRSIIPNVKPPFQLVGAIAKDDSLYNVAKLSEVDSLYESDES